MEKGSEFCNIPMESWLSDNYIEMCSTHNKAKSVAAERSVITLKNKIYKCVTSVAKNVHIDKLGNIANKFSNK